MQRNNCKDCVEAWKQDYNWLTFQKKYFKDHNDAGTQPLRC